MNKLYGIRVDGDESEIVRVLSLLFSKGYVYGTDRIKDIDTFMMRYKDSKYGLSGWNWFVMGHNFKCKMIILGWIQFGRSYGEIGITVEDFIKLNE